MATASQVTADDTIARFAEAAARDVPALAERIWAHARETSPAGRLNAATTATAVLGAEANLRTLIGLLRVGDRVEEVVVPGVTLAQVRDAVHAGTDLAYILRDFHSGAEEWRQYFARELAARTQTAAELSAASAVVSDATFRYLRIVTDAVTATYADETRRWQESGGAARRAVVDALLVGGPIGQPAAELRLGYPLRGPHVGLVAWWTAGAATADPDPELLGAVERAAEDLGARARFALDAGPGTVWGWCTVAAGRSVTTTDLPRPPDGVSLAAGTPHLGPAGFRTTHREARSAFRAAEHAADGRRVLAFASGELAFLLGGDAERARTFALRELGGLADAGDVPARLRATLEAYFASSANTTRTAERLGIHKNTILYRLRQAGALRGTPITEHRLELEVALRLVRTLPGVLDERG